jgi:alpha-galactosidase
MIARRPVASAVSAAVAALAAMMLPLAAALDNDVGRTPILGFNSWNIFACAVNETLMRDTMDAFVSLGLRDAGYVYVGVDDCWAKSRDPTTSVIQPDPATFPSGMAALADYAHARGLKFGLYSSNSPNTCDGRPGSFGYETLDAQTYASWGVDLLKYDNCGDMHTIGQPEARYPVMRDALNATGRQMIFAACEWAVDFPGTWMAPVAHSWRATYDIQNTWECVVPHLDWINVYADFAGPGHFNDGDILESFNGVLTKDESVAHLALWAAMKSPLLIGCDLRQPECQSGVPYFTNPELLAISQDALGAQARRVAASGGDKGVPHGKSGLCGTEELPQNTIIAPCDPADPFQRWTVQSNGSILLAQTGECLQLDSGQGGHCSQEWDVWYNNAASSLCNDPASSCAGKQELWSYNVPGRTLTNAASSQCLTVHAGALHNVGLLPCSPIIGGLQSWDWNAPTGQFVSSAAPPDSGNRKFCLARTKDVLGGALETWAGPLANGDLVVILFNRNYASPVQMTASWADLGLDPAKRMAVRDVLARADNGTATGSFATASPVPVHGVAVLRLSAA